MLSSKDDSPARIAIAVVERDGCYLIGQRPQGAPLAGLWEFPGGKIEPGETPAEAARRECREEAGLDVEVQFAYSTVEHQYAHGRVKLHFFACAALAPLPAPKPPFEWAPAAKLAELPFPAANAALVEQLAHSRSAQTRGSPSSSST